MMLTNERSSTYRERLKKQVMEAIVRRGLSAREVSFAVVGHDGLIRDIKDGRIPSADRVEALFEFLEIGPPPEPATLQPLHIAEGEFIPIPERAAQLAAGDGHANDGDLIIGHLVFRKDWLQRLGILAEKASLARVTGNSMAPLIRDGDLVLVDTRDSAKEVPVRPMKPGKAAPIYVFHQDGGDRVKRIARPTDEMTLILSDNPEFPPEVLTGPRQRALNIIGRVRWWGHTVED